MSRLTDIVGELRDTEAELSRLESTIVGNPQYESLRIDLLSLQKRQRRLEDEFQSLTNESQIEVLQYRIIPAIEEKIPVLAMTSTLQTFQIAVSTIFDALKNGPKKRGRISADAMALSEFDFAYASSGSLIVTLTIPNDRLLIGETLLDKAISEFFSAALAENRSEIIQFARQTGIPSVRRLYEWTDAINSYGISTNIQWRRRDQVRAQLEIQPANIARLREIIEETSDTDVQHTEITGVLVGLDVDLKTFHIKVPDADDIQGRWGEEFLYNPQFTLNSRYIVNLTKKLKTYYAYERDEISWELVRLREIAQ